MPSCIRIVTTDMSSPRPTEGTIPALSQNVDKNLSFPALQDKPLKRHHDGGHHRVPKISQSKRRRTRAWSVTIFVASSVVTDFYEGHKYPLQFETRLIQNKKGRVLIAAQLPSLGCLY